ncbi:MAG: hypothetical protein V4692_04680 [Bdellovibrionota bacterium]
MMELRLKLRHFLLLIAFVAPLAAQAVEGGNTCPAYFADVEAAAGLAELGIHGKNLEWRRLQYPLRSKKVKDLADRYVDHMTRSLVPIAKYFASDDLRYDAFTEALFEQHRLAIGQLGDSYTGYFNGNRGSTLYLERAGDLRNYAPQIELYRLFVKPLPFYMHSAAKKFISTNLKEEISIRGIPNLAAPKRHQRWPGENEHSFSQPEYIPVYFERMHEIALRIRACKACSLAELAPLLGEYYHVGINAHIFDRVNTSILMAQVNYHLIRNGHRGIQHTIARPFPTRIDAYAFLLTTEAFIEAFVGEVARANP